MTYDDRIDALLEWIPLTVKDFLHFEQIIDTGSSLTKQITPGLRILRVHKTNKEQLLSEPVDSMPICWQWMSTVRNAWVASVAVV